MTKEEFSTKTRDGNLGERIYVTVVCQMHPSYSLCKKKDENDDEKAVEMILVFRLQFVLVFLSFFQKFSLWLRQQISWSLVLPTAFDTLFFFSDFLRVIL